MCQGQDPSCPSLITILDTLPFFQLYLIIAFSWSDFQRTHGQNFTVRLPTVLNATAQAGWRAQKECSVEKTHLHQAVVLQWEAPDRVFSGSIHLCQIKQITYYLLAKEKQSSQRHLRWKCNILMLSKREQFSLGYYHTQNTSFYPKLGRKLMPSPVHLPQEIKPREIGSDLRIPWRWYTQGNNPTRGVSTPGFSLLHGWPIERLLYLGLFASLWTEGLA